MAYFLDMSDFGQCSGVFGGNYFFLLMFLDFVLCFSDIALFYVCCFSDFVLCFLDIAFFYVCCFSDFVLCVFGHCNLCVCVVF